MLVTICTVGTVGMSQFRENPKCHCSLLILTYTPPLLLLRRFSRVRLCATHRRQPTRLPRPWDSPGKNTGVGCHFLLQCMKVKSESEGAQSCLTLATHGLQPTRLLRPWDFLGKSTGVGCHCLLHTPPQRKLNFVSSSSCPFSCRFTVRT